MLLLSTVFRISYATPFAPFAGFLSFDPECSTRFFCFSILSKRIVDSYRVWCCVLLGVRFENGSAADSTAGVSEAEFLTLDSDPNRVTFYGIMCVDKCEGIFQKDRFASFYIVQFFECFWKNFLSSACDELCFYSFYQGSKYIHSYGISDKNR